MFIRKITAIGLTISLIGALFVAPLYSAWALVPVPPPPPAPAGIPVITTFDKDFYIDTYIIQPLIRTLVAKIGNSLENRMLNSIGAIISDAAGGGKDPHFVTDWRNLIFNAQGRGNDVFRSIIADTDFCSYFSDNIKRSTGANLFSGILRKLGNSGSKTNIPGMPSFQYLNKCSLSSDIDINAFSKDFTKGGWKAWEELLRPENNIFGVYGNVLREQMIQVAVEEKAAKDEAVAGKGYLPNRENSDKTSADADNSVTGKASGCAAKGILTRCTVQGKTVTPGSLFGDAATRKLDQKFATVGGAKTIEDLILILTDAIIGKISGQLTNLLGRDSNGNPTQDSYFGSFDPTQDIGQDIPDSGNTVDPGGSDQITIRRQVCQQTCLSQQLPQCDQLPPDQQQTCRDDTVTTCQAQCP